MKLHLFDSSKKIPEQCNILIGFPSVGNVGQLAMDSILSTLGPHAQRIGCIESDHVLPMSGYDRMFPTAPIQLCLPVEVYLSTSADTSFVVILQRCPVIQSKLKVYTEELFDLLTSWQSNVIIVLTGASLNPYENATSLHTLSEK